MKDFLPSAAAAFGLELEPAILDKLALYAHLLIKKNKVMNLSAITEPEKIATLHFLDSLALSKFADFSGKKVIDVGSGAGFPGLPLKLYDESMELTLLDSLQKRINWLKGLCAELRVEAECIHARAEEQSLLPGYFESYDFALSRALARLNLLCELCLPFVKPGGYFLAMKAEDCGKELEESQNALLTMGGSVEAVFDYLLPFENIRRKLIVIKKTASAEKGYPRRYSRIVKRPL